MRGHIQTRTSERTGKITYRVRVYVGKRDAERYGIESRWYDGGTYERKRSKKGRESAEDGLAALLARLTGQEEAASRETVEELLTRWQRDSVSVDKRPNTVRHHAKNVALHIAPQIGAVLASDLSPADVAAWQAGRIAAGCAPKSVRSYRGTLHACYEWARRLGVVASNPVAPVPPPRLAERRVVAPTIADSRRYLDALKDTRLWPALVLAAMTGMRRGEILALRWSDVDLAGGTASVTRQLTGSNKATLAFAPTKTARGRRTIWLPPACVAELSALMLQRRRTLPPGGKWDPEALICCGRRGQPIVPDGFTSELWRRLRRAGLPPLHLHELRHLWGTEAIRAGVPMNVVSEHLGHANVATTLDVYSHVTQADLSQAASRFGEAWEAAEKAAEREKRAESEAKPGVVLEMRPRKACT